MLTQSSKLLLFAAFLVFEVPLDVAIKVGKPTGTTSRLHTLDHFERPGVLLDLLIDEPLHQHLDRVIFGR